MGARRGLLNPIMRRVEKAHGMPKFSIRQKLGEARRDEAGLFNHLWHTAERSKTLRSYEDREAAEEALNKFGTPLYDHQYHPTKGWRVTRV